MTEQAELDFGALLRQLRFEGGLTQEELAEAARVSQRAVSDLERGINRTARKDTAQLLADALGLDGPARELFIAAARGRAPAGDVLAARGAPRGAFAAAATRALPRDIAAFTGRQAELDRLAAGLDGLSADGGVVGIHAIDGMAGIGKTTFAVHAAHRLAGRFPDGQFFLPLHAHTAGQRRVDPADGLASLLLAAGLATAQIPPGLEARAARWRDHVAGRKILLVLDDAAGHQQVRPLLPGTAGSLVLVTSRRRLAALEDAAVISLDVLPVGEAAALLARLAGRADVTAGDVAAGEIARLCGYLPLAIGMLASQLRHHRAWSAADLAGTLADARDRLGMMRAENLSVAAAFGLSYADLTEDQQRLFRRLGLVPGPSFDALAAAALDDTTVGQARRCLEELYEQHLIIEAAPGRYQLHDLLREHARALAATDNDPAESGAAAGRLLDYYLRTAQAAGRHIPTWTAVQGSPPPEDPLAQAPQLATLEQAAAWLETEGPNLHAAADYAAARGMHLHAVQIPATMGGFLRAHGDWDQSAALHRTALSAARHAEDRQGQAVAYRHLGILAWMTGDLPAAAAHLARAVALYGEIGDRPGQAYALDHLGVVEQLTGDYPAALASRRQALALARSSSDRLAEAVALAHLGWIQQLTGDYPAAAASLQQSLALFHGLAHQLGEADALGQLGQLQMEMGDYPAATASSEQSLTLYRGAAHRPFEAVELGRLGHLQMELGDYPAAAATLQQALELHRDLGARVNETEVLNSLGTLSLRMTATGQARERHTQALDIARDIGMPLEEARALEGIGNSHLQDRDPGQAAQYLREALTIYQRIGAPDTRHVQETLRQDLP